MTAPSGRRPAQRPDLPKAPTSGHPARRPVEDPPAAPPAASTPATSSSEQLVNFGARIPVSVRRRARLYSVTHEVELQDVLAAALTEYLDRHE